MQPHDEQRAYNERTTRQAVAWRMWPQLLWERGVRVHGTFVFTFMAQTALGGCLEMAL